MRIGIFSDTHWSMGRVYKDVANTIPDWDFEFIDWANWTQESIQKMYNECDVVIINLAAIELFLDKFDISKTIFISHGFEENQGRYIPPSLVYGITSESIRPLFPNESKVFLVPNGVDHTKFDYKNISGELKTIGWCGCPNVWYKQCIWSVEIANKTNTKLCISSGTPCEDDLSKWTSLTYDEVREWYSGIDLLLITSIPTDPKYETGPLPAFEAIVSGIPVVGTPVGNFADVPGPKFSTIEEGIEIVNQLKSNPEQMKALAKDQYEYVMKNNTYQSFAHKWREALEYVYSQKTRFT